MFSSENNVMSFKAPKKMPENQPTEPYEFLSEAIVDAFAASKKRSNQMILISAPAWVKKIIHMMHVARIAEVRDWSRLAPTRNPDEVISLVQRPRAED
jgi:hypothetical protein